MNFTTGMASWARRGALAGAALVLAVALLVAGARAAEERAESGSIHHLRPVTAGDAVYGGHQIPYIFARTESPTAASATGGVILAFMPLADFERDADHRPVVEISDPGRGGDGVLVKIGEKPYRCRTAEELARKVQEGEVDPQQPINVSLRVRLYADVNIKKVVYQACLAQLKRIEERAGTAANDLGLGDLDRVIMLPARELRLVCLTPGLESVNISLGDNPNMATSLLVQAKVPALFISHLHSRAGLQLALKCRFDTYGERTSGLFARQVVRAVVDHLLEGNGQGGLKYRTDATGGDVQVLCTRQVIDRLQKSADFRRDVFVRGASTEDINLLLGLLQKEDADLLAVAVQQVEELLRRNYNLRELWNKPGYLKAVQRLDNNEAMTREEHERFWADFRSTSSSTSGGGGLSVGPFSLGGGGGASEAETSASKEQRRDATEQFVRDLRSYKIDGHFPVHPNLNYRLLARHRIEDAYEQNYVLQRAGAPGEQVLTSLFCSARETIEQGKEDQQVSDWQREVADYRARANKAREAAGGSRTR